MPKRYWKPSNLQINLPSSRVSDFRTDDDEFHHQIVLMGTYYIVVMACGAGCFCFTRLPIFVAGFCVMSDELSLTQLWVLDGVAISSSFVSTCGSALIMWRTIKISWTKGFSADRVWPVRSGFADVSQVYSHNNMKDSNVAYTELGCSEIGG